MRTQWSGKGKECDRNLSFFPLFPWYIFLQRTIRRMDVTDDHNVRDESSKTFVFDYEGSSLAVLTFGIEWLG